MKKIPVGTTVRFTGRSAKRVGKVVQHEDDGRVVVRLNLTGMAVRRAPSDLEVYNG